MSLVLFFLWTGVMRDSFHFSGKIDVLNIKLKITDNGSHKTDAQSRMRNEGIASGPAVKLALSFLIELQISLESTFLTYKMFLFRLLKFSCYYLF